MPQIATLTLNPAIDVATSVSRLQPVVKLRCRPESRDAGGGGINVARVAQRLGASVVALHASGGVTGRMLVELLEREGLPQQALPADGATRESFTIVEEATGAEYRFVLPGPAMPAPHWALLLDALQALPRGLAWLVASGSLPPEAPVDAYAQVAQWARGRSLPMALDTAGAPLAAAIRGGGLALIKPNLRELQELVGQALPDESSRVAACRSLVASGAVASVALSMGSEGALLVDAREAWACPALDVPVRSSVGAGDSFLGALVCALADGEPAGQALARAVAAGCAALLHPGTRLALAEDVQRLSTVAQPRRLG